MLPLLHQMTGSPTPIPALSPPSVGAPYPYFRSYLFSLSKRLRLR
ncbi:hypothetical protein, unlikely [Trypanosoma brucei brucei TREU927]|uniref:Uncharacterized protein n=1 Tax=Trypanosoma brucei brucei (strain 927/4 GUTat10.1) TaxID=185431 RepID=Q38FA3_TRYB2|nr:hypothetical protein, unlikely [Trypanosoma brucei brucei TREU927]EAN76517.1 hypothetical protein, unlikely [Trypanosoma brucei brucei TREU927]